MALPAREGHDEVGLTDAGAIVTEKLATKLGLSAGDAIVFAEQDDLGNATATTYLARDGHHATAIMPS